MKYKSRSIRAFIGAKDFNESLDFYNELGFQEVPLGPSMSYIRIDEKMGFYLQKAYVKDWVDNTMLFWEVEDLDEFAKALNAKNLPNKFPGVRISPIKIDEWGRELFMHDPSGILWHIGEFNS